EVVGVGDLVGGGDCRAERQERVEGLAVLVAGESRFAFLRRTSRDVAAGCVAEHVSQGLIRRYFLAIPADYHRELRLVVEDDRLELGKDDGFVRADNGVWRLEEGAQWPRRRDLDAFLVVTLA